MFNNKYVAVQSDPEDTTVDFAPMKRKVCTNACLWTSLFTGILIVCYGIPSIGLTFYQRWLYQSFRFPLITVLVHMTIKYLLAISIRFVLAKYQRQPRVVLGWSDYVKAVVPTGVFSGIDIGFSNWGLELISVSLYTMTKSTTIIFILIFAIIFKLEKKSWSLFIIVLTISVGLILFTYKSTQFNFLGFVLLLLASISSGVRWTCVQILMQRSKMGMRNPVDMIFHMQPSMIASLLPFALWMEGPDVIRNCQLFRMHDYSTLISISLKILLGALIAFVMEFSEMTLVTYTSSLTLVIAGMFKEIIMLILAVGNGDVLSPINIVGLLVCLSGIGCHVLHKIQTSSSRSPRLSVSYEEKEMVEGGESLIESVSMSEHSDEGELSDTQVLFDILNRHDR